MKKILSLILIQGILFTYSYALKIDTIKINNEPLFSASTLNNQSILNQSWEYHQNKNYLNIQGAFFNQSNSVNTQIAYAILFKSFIDDAIKQRTFKKLSIKNAYEDEARWALQYAHYSPKLKLSYSFAYTYRNTRNMTFNKDAFQFVFAGNKMFEDDTIALQKVNFNYVAYNQLQIGISKTIQKPNHTVIIGGAVSLLQSPQYLNLKVDKSAIYTAPYGEYLDVKYNLQAQQANNGAPEFFSFKGTGMSADLHFSYQRYHSWMLRFNVNDIGFIKYSNEINTYKGDSAIRFEGIVIDNILNFTTPTIFKDFKSDSLFKILNIENSKKSFLYIHPVSFQLAFSKAILKNKAMVTIGIQQKTLPRYYPYVWSKFSYNCKHNFIPSINIAFGGYSYYNLGFELVKKVKLASFCIGSNNVLGLVIPQHFTSSSLYLRVSVVF